MDFERFVRPSASKSASLRPPLSDDLDEALQSLQRDLYKAFSPAVGSGPGHTSPVRQIDPIDSSVGRGRHQYCQQRRSQRPRLSNRVQKRKLTPGRKTWRARSSPGVEFVRRELEGPDAQWALEQPADRL